MHFLRRFPIALFLIAAFVITYVGGIAAYLLLKKTQAFIGTDVAYINDWLLKFGPSLAGLLSAWLVAGSRGMRDLLGRLIRWRAAPLLYLIAVVFPSAAFLLVLLLRGHASELGTVAPVAALGVFAMQMLIHTFVGGGLGEEIGWRGFLLPRLCARYSPLIASLLVAIAWFVWHVPGYLLTDKAEADPILPFAVMVFPMSIVLTWLYFRAGESLLLPVLMHASINASFYSMVLLLPKMTQSAGFQPTYDWMLAGVWCVLAIVILAGAGRQLGRSVVSDPIQPTP